MFFYEMTEKQKQEHIASVISIIRKDVWITKGKSMFDIPYYKGRTNYIEYVIINGTIQTFLDHKRFVCYHLDYMQGNISMCDLIEYGKFLEYAKDMIFDDFYPYEFYKPLLRDN